MSEFWYQSPYNNRHPKLKEATSVTYDKGYIELPHGTIVQPIRPRYLPYGCWVIDMIWSEKEHVICYVEKYGFCIVPARSINFDK